MHCSKTLNEIWLDDSVNNFLDEFTNPFEKVQKVYLIGQLETERKLNEIFPSIRQLDMNIYKSSFQINCQKIR